MANKPDQWMPLYIGDYLRDTSRLTRDQHGGYLLLIMDTWVNGPLPDDDRVLGNIAKATPAEWRKLRPVLSAFFKVKGGHWTHSRVERERSKTSGLVEKKRAAGSAGGIAARGKSGRRKDGTPIAGEIAPEIADGIALPFSEQQKTGEKELQKNAQPQPPPHPPSQEEDKPSALSQGAPSPQADAFAPSEQQLGDRENLFKLLNLLNLDDGYQNRLTFNSLITREGFDFERHLLPAAQKAKDGGRKVSQLGYIRTIAKEIRDNLETAAKFGAAKSAADEPFEDVDDFGWRGRIRFYIAHPEFKPENRWPAKWGPRWDLPDTKCPSNVVAEFKAKSEAA